MFTLLELSLTVFILVHLQWHDVRLPKQQATRRPTSWLKANQIRRMSMVHYHKSLTVDMSLCCLFLRPKSALEVTGEWCQAAVLRTQSREYQILVHKRRWVNRDVIATIYFISLSALCILLSTPTGYVHLSQGRSRADAFPGPSPLSSDSQSAPG